jgi:Ca-activated chloride channel family protein
MSDFLEHFRFAEPLWLLLLLPVAILPLLRRGRGNGSGLIFSSLSVLGSLGTRSRQRSGGFAVPLLVIALVPAVLGLARPVWRNEYSKRNASGIDIVIAFDVSLSMEIDDFLHPDGRPLQRLDAAKEVVTDFIRRRPDDRIGLVIFAGRPYSVSPITLDHKWLTDRLAAAQPSQINEQGTAIGSALSASAVRLDQRDAASKIILLVTDGANNSGKIDPVEAAELAAELGIKIYAISLGTEDGRVSRNIQRFPTQEFDVPTLQKITKISGGEFFRALDTASLQDSFRSIDALEKTEVKSYQVIEDHELSPWFLGASLLLAVAAALSRALNPPPMP